MAVHQNTFETYDNKVIREDLQQAYSMVSPEETPFHQICSVKTVTNHTFDWPTVDLDEVNMNNAVIEGDDGPTVNKPTSANRMQNITQITDAQVSVSHTSEAVDAAANNLQEVSEQVTLKIRALKRSCEAIALNNVGANPGASGTARKLAGFPAHIRTNFKVGTGGAATGPTLSSAPDGYPTAGWTAMTAVPITEMDFADAIEKAWLEGSDTTIAMVTANNKRIISQEFTGNSTRYKDAVDKSLVASIDIYTSDFNELQVVPNRFLPAMDNNGVTVAGSVFPVLFIDPNFVRITELEGTKQKPLAETGHSRKRLIWREWSIQVDNEKAHAIMPVTNGAAPPIPVP